TLAPEASRRRGAGRESWGCLLANPVAELEPELRDDRLQTRVTLDLVAPERPTLRGGDLMRRRGGQFDSAVLVLVSQDHIITPRPPDLGGVGSALGGLGVDPRGVVSQTLGLTWLGLAERGLGVGHGPAVIAQTQPGLPSAHVGIAAGGIALDGALEIAVGEG